MRASLFKVLYQSKAKKSKARLGEINTAHGTVKTPSFVPVATKGTLKAIPPQFIKEIGTQLAFVNTYHLVTHPGADLIANAKGIHNFAKLDIPLMSDSGGFQVFSLANRKNNSQFSISHFQTDNNLKTNNLRKANIHGEEEPLLIKLSDNGVIFRSTFDGSAIEFTPEKSMEYQVKIGADLMMVFDECTYYPSTHEYAKKAMERTHKWLLKCIDHKKRIDSVRGFLPASARPTIKPSNLRAVGIPFISATYPQYLYGIIQGATFEDLRKKSARFISEQPVDGVAIGGVSVGETKAEMREQVRWVAPYLPKDKPVHLLGVGHIDDIFDLVNYGIDTFDCVEPTRLARMGAIYQWKFVADLLRRRNYQIDINKTLYKFDLSAIDQDCNCWVCHNFTKAYLHHLFKQREILGYTLATYHNLSVMERLFSLIRKLIAEDKL